jgi:nucleoside-diphosphate-sugar epimerase
MVLRSLAGPKPARDDLLHDDKEDSMRVLVVGASGAIGTRLVPKLIERGHDVVGSYRSPAGAERLRALGAEPIALDALDARAVREAVARTEPEAIAHEATALSHAKFGRDFDKAFAETNELRTRGTDALLAAARESGVRRLVAQSFASYRYVRQGGPVKTEDDPLDPAPPANAQRSFAAMAHVDRAVTDFGGIVLRYGAFYGAANDGLVEPVRKRQFPIVGGGGGITSFIHLEDAAAATVLALEKDGPAIYNIVDDEPAPAREWLPVYAQALGAKPPRRFPTWFARLLAGEAAVVMNTSARGASNVKAKRELGWTLRYPSWRQGFFEAYDGVPARPEPAAQDADRRAA